VDRRALLALTAGVCIGVVIGILMGLEISYRLAGRP
jgi:ABC-type nitrate/sulfonate/bicarbonate transport system permease component